LSQGLLPSMAKESFHHSSAKAISGASKSTIATEQILKQLPRPIMPPCAATLGIAEAKAKRAAEVEARWLQVQPQSSSDDPPNSRLTIDDQKKDRCFSAPAPD
jgi:hypothetical protein